MKRALRWLLRIWLASALLGGLLLVAGLVFLETSYGQDVVRRAVERQLRGVMVGGVHVGHVSGTPFSDIVVADLELDGPDGARAIAVGELRVRVALLPLLRRRIVVTKLVASDVDVNVRREATGELELADMTKPGPRSDWSVRLERIEVHRAHAAYASGATIDLDAIEGGGNVSMPANGPIAGHVALAGRWRQR
ncbi:MAG TPA: hypothetical protein VMJ10_36115, partial [Kofleriaceae bacterium]|nr:hypothetical protein [Kofleriaceae bacterium]